MKKVLELLKGVDQRLGKIEELFNSEKQKVSVLLSSIVKEIDGLQTDSAEEQKKINRTLDNIVAKLGNLDKKIDFYQKTNRECNKVCFEQVIDKIEEMK